MIVCKWKNQRWCNKNTLDLRLDLARELVSWARRPPTCLGVGLTLQRQIWVQENLKTSSSEAAQWSSFFELQIFTSHFMPTQNSVTWPCHSRELSCKSLNHFSECPHSSGLKSSLVVLRLEPSQLSLGTAFALFVVDLESRVGTSYCISGPGLQSFKTSVCLKLLQRWWPFQVWLAQSRGSILCLESCGRRRWAICNTVADITYIIIYIYII